jgi:RNA polymerase sigma-54 factor
MLSLSQRQSLQQRLSPQQVQYLKMLQLPVIALEQRIKQELEVNPMLEELLDGLQETEVEQEFDQDQTLPLPETRSERSDDAPSSDSEESFPEREREIDWEEIMPEEYDGYKAPTFTGPDSEEQEELPQKSEPSFAERLLEQLRMQVSTEDELALAEEIIGNIDDDGYLRRNLNEIVDDLNKFLALTHHATSQVRNGHRLGDGRFDAYEDLLSDEPFGRDRLVSHILNDQDELDETDQRENLDDMPVDPFGPSAFDDDDGLSTGGNRAGRSSYGSGGSQQATATAPTDTASPLSLSLEEMSHLSIEDLARMLEQGTSAVAVPIQNDTVVAEEHQEALPVIEPVFSVEEAERVLHRIQRLDPPAIGSRDLQECLCIQLELEDDQAPAHRLAYRVVKESYTEFAMKHFEKICHRLECTTEELKQAIEVIRSLNPKPGEGSVSIVNDNYLTPDFVIERDVEDFLIVPNDRHIPILRINRAYQEMMRRKGVKKAAIDRDTRKFLREKFEAAKWFIASIQQRRQTMMKVMRAIVDLQIDFFRQGPDHIRPMIYKDVAEKIGMDISTVCRVVNGKYTQTDYGTFELRYFFSEKLETTSGEEVSTKIVKSRIQEMIEAEDKAKPLSDDAISRAMKKAGFNVARRTVAKYREQMNIPVARLRRAL